MTISSIENDADHSNSRGRKKKRRKRAAQFAENFVVFFMGE
jgi:hypothetical protein